MSWLELFHLLKACVPAPFIPSHPSPNSISKLPDELLIIIFHHAISSFRPQEHLQSPIHLQTLLAQVSRGWRCIVSSTPSLWVHVPIAPYQSSHALQEFLRNSSSLPISVTVYPWPVVPIHTAIKSLDVQLHTLLQAQSSRERIMSLRIDATGLDDLVDRVARTWQEACGNQPTRALESVFLKGASHTVWQGTQFFDSPIAPALRTLVMEDMPLGWFQEPSQCGSLCNVTILVWRHSPGFGRVSVLEFYQLVSAFSGVTTVVLDGPVVDFDAPTRVAAPFGVGVPYLGALVESVKSVHITDECDASTCLTVLFRLFPCMTQLFVGPCPTTVTRVIPASREFNGPCVLPCAQKVDDDVCVCKGPAGRCGGVWLNERGGNAVRVFTML